MFFRKILVISENIFKIFTEIVKLNPARGLIQMRYCVPHSQNSFRQKITSQAYFISPKLLVTTFTNILYNFWPLLKPKIP